MSRLAPPRHGERARSRAAHPPRDASASRSRRTVTVRPPSTEPSSAVTAAAASRALPNSTVPHPSEAPSSSLEIFAYAASRPDEDAKSFSSCHCAPPPTRTPPAHPPARVQ